MKKYIGFIAIVCVLLGIASQQQTLLPNQEVVLEFNHVEVSTLDTQNTFVVVEQRLRELGATHIEIVDNELGKLKITYHSEADVTIIKRALVLDFDLDLADHDSETPSDNQIEYDIQVSEIQKSNEADWSLEGTYVLELKSEYGRSFVPISFLAMTCASENALEQQIKSSLKIQQNVVLSIHNQHYNIPEVRAGPLT